MSGKKYKKILLYTVLAAVIFLPGAFKQQGLNAQKAKNEAKPKVLTNENNSLAEENKKLKEDSLYIEKMARENLGLAKKDEVVVKFKNDVPPRP